MKEPGAASTLARFLVPAPARPFARRVRAAVVVTSGLLLYVVLIAALAVETRLLRRGASNRAA